jgi:hypothetical protein
MSIDLELGQIISFGKDPIKYEVCEVADGMTRFRKASPAAIHRHDQKHLLIAKVNSRLAQLWMNGWMKRVH